MFCRLLLSYYTVELGGVLALVSKTFPQLSRQANEFPLLDAREIACLFFVLSTGGNQTLSTTKVPNSTQMILNTLQANGNEVIEQRS